jgi:hypothetical protein
MFGFPFRPLTEFPLHFIDIHGSILPCSRQLPLLQKSSRAKGLRHWGRLLLLVPIVWTAFPSSDYYALTATFRGIGVFVGVALTYFHSP